MREHLSKLVSLVTKNNTFEGSKNYWEGRYDKGGTSGAGSYGRLSEFKASVINDFVKKRKIDSVIEWGCGDGNQLLLSEYPHYIGLDVSKKAVELCSEQFQDRQNYSFFWLESNDGSDLKAQLALSLDVIYHLVEDDVYNTYMTRLFNSAEEYVIVYSCDFNKDHAPHVKCRMFTPWVKENCPEWELEEMIENPYSDWENDQENCSWSNFFIFRRSNLHYSSSH